MQRQLRPVGLRRHLKFYRISTSTTRLGFRNTWVDSLVPFEKMSTSDFVVPHRLCRYCTALVEKATCLKHSLDELLLRNLDQPLDYYPVQHIIEAYPSIRTIVLNGNGGCHLCCNIMRGMRLAAVKNSLNTRRESNGVITAMIRLDPDSDSRDASFEVLFYEGRRPREEDLTTRKIGMTVFRRVKNQHVKSCQNCENCLVKFFPHQKYDSLKYAHFRWIEYTGSTTSTQMIRGWLDYCLKNHASCTIGGPPRRPTQLLDLNGADPDGDLRLVSGLETQSQPYATLSYCWGVCKTTTLTRATYDAFCQCIRFNSLPRTSQHAVAICRKLAIPYLWIDALCIIQGPNGDWDTEASLMGSVYAGSTLTIAAADAGESNDGFLHYRSPLRSQACRLFRDDTHTVFAGNSVSCCRPDSCPALCRLDTRGWVLQERTLSPRTVYFGPNGVHWECRGGNLCDEQPRFWHKPYPYSTHTLRSRTIKNLYQALCEIASASTSPKVQEDFLSCWNRIINLYSQTRLSYESDKLVAIAGIASTFQDRLGLQASYGLWLSCFDIQLLWRTRRATNYPDFRSYSKNDYAPTWSWASMSGATLDFENYEEQRHVMVTFEKLPSPTTFSRADTLPPAGTPESIIRLKGMLRHFQLSDSWRENNSQSLINPASQADDHDWPFCLFLADVPFDVHSTPLYCLLITRTRHEVDYVDRIDDSGLVLTPVESSRNRFRRIGYFQYGKRFDGREQDVFASTPLQSGIEIV